jgi:hypothetical protein
MTLKLGKQLRGSRCKWDKDWQVYECGNAHSGLFGRLNCQQCRNKGTLCASGKHPSNKHRSDW